MLRQGGTVLITALVIWVVDCKETEDLADLRRCERGIEKKFKGQTLSTFERRAACKRDWVEFWLNVDALNMFEDECSRANFRDSCISLADVDGRCINSGSDPCFKFVAIGERHAPNDHSGAMTGYEFFPAEFDGFFRSECGFHGGGRGLAGSEKLLFSGFPKLIGGLSQSARYVDEPTGDKNQEKRETSDDEALIVVHELTDRSGESRDATSEWFAYGLLFFVMTPVIGLICRRWLTVAWGAGALCLLLIGAV